MEKNKMLYEALYIINNTIGEEEIKAVVEKFSTLVAENSEVETINEWGMRRLAYPIQDMTEGYYVLMRFRSESAFPAELERLLNINDHVLRSLITVAE